MTGLVSVGEWQGRREKTRPVDVDRLALLDHDPGFDSLAFGKPAPIRAE